MLVKLNDAATRLAEICEKIDEGEEVTDILQADFNTALSDVTAAVDRRKAFFREIDSKIELAKKYKDEITKALKKYENLRERLLEHTKNVVECNPDIPFKDSLGKRLVVVKNPVPKMIVGSGWEDSRFSKIETTLILDKEALKDALMRGEQVPFASLELGKQLRGLK